MSKQNTLGLPRHTTLTLQHYHVPTVQCCSGLGDGRYSWLMSTVRIMFGLVLGENRKERFLEWLYGEEKVQNRRYNRIFVNMSIQLDTQKCCLCVWYVIFQDTCMVWWIHMGLKSQRYSSNNKLSSLPMTKNLNPMWIELLRKRYELEMEICTLFILNFYFEYFCCLKNL